MQIIFIHGMGRTALSLWPLGARLAWRGHGAAYFSYSAASQSFACITSRLVAAIQHRAATEPYALVSHSLGGILARASLPMLLDNPPRQLVMLAPPNRSPLLARRLHSNRLFQLATGDCGQRLADQSFYQTLGRPSVPTAIIAGMAGPRGRWSPFGAQLNDGVVAVDETMLAGAAAPILVPAIHTLIMNSRLVARLIGEILERGDTASVSRTRLS